MALVSLVGGMGLGVLGGPVLSIGDVVVSVNEGVKGRLSTEVRLETGDGEDNVGRGEVDGGTDTRGSAEAGRGEEDGGADDEEEGKGTVIMTVVVELLVMVVVPSANYQHFSTLRPIRFAGAPRCLNMPHLLFPAINIRIFRNTSADFQHIFLSDCSTFDDLPRNVVSNSVAS